MSNQHDQDRDRIAEAMGWNFDGVEWTHDTHRKRYDHPLPPTLDAAIAAFETLCEPKGWGLGLDPETEWYAVRPVGTDGADSIWVPITRNHAADVCRLVCEVLDREANPPENQCPECGTLMVRSGAVWKCINCGATKEPTNAQ